MSTIQEKANNDLKQTMIWINSRNNKDWIYNMFIKGPPENKGFMWCDQEGGENKWWSEKESQGLKDVTQYVLDLGWDSSGYGLFMRKIQNHIKSQFENKKIRNQFAKKYKKTEFYNMMDDNNKKIMDIWEKDGTESAINKMMENAGGDYGRMRLIYG